MDRREAFFNKLAKTFDLEQRLFFIIRDREWHTAFPLLQQVLSPGMSVCEIGAGTGRFTLKIAPMVKNMVAVDISENMLGRMELKLARAGITNVNRIHGDIMTVDLEQTFDAVVSFSAVEYILDEEGLFAKLASLVRPGGVLLLTTSHDSALRWISRIGNWVRTGVLLRASTRSRLRELLQRNAFDVIRCDDFFLKTPLTRGMMLLVIGKKQNGTAL